MERKAGLAALEDEAEWVETEGERAALGPGED